MPVLWVHATWTVPTPSTPSVGPVALVSEVARPSEDQVVLALALT
jgi:hypothetical protein